MVPGEPGEVRVDEGGHPVLVLGHEGEAEPPRVVRGRLVERVVREERVQEPGEGDDDVLRRDVAEAPEEVLGDDLLARVRVGGDRENVRRRIAPRL